MGSPGPNGARRTTPAGGSGAFGPPAAGLGAAADRWDLRAACAALAAAPAHVITATTLVGGLAGTPGEARLLRALADELAAEHGLVATFESDGRRYVIRVSRAEPAAAGRAGAAAAATRIRRW